MNDLSLDIINKKSPYLIKRADDGDYVFQTEVLYMVLVLLKMIHLEVVKHINYL